jgi:hypothetical protein
MEIKNYTEGDEVKILELFELVFKQKFSIENWMWRFRHNPAGKHLIKLMWEGDKLIGQYAVSPIIMKVDGHDVLTAHSLSTMTHPDYGGRGIFKQLSTALYDELENNLNCKAIWGFPNNNSHYGFVKSLKWENLSVLHTLGLDIKKIQKKDIKFKVKTIDKFDEPHSNFINEKISSFASVYVKKDVEYLNWRFTDKPTTKYWCYEFESDSGKAVIITKFYPTGNNNKYDLNIVDCFMDNYEEIHDYIDFIIKESKLEFHRVSMWTNLFDPNHLLLERQGFVPVLPQTYLAARIHHSMPELFTNYKNWYISMSDSDVF